VNELRMEDEGVELEGGGVKELRMEDKGVEFEGG
jgi:hypothetical protein